MFLSEMDFIRKEIAIWGEDYIYDLMDKGYVAKLTTAGWKWFHDPTYVLNQPERLLANVA